MADAINLFSSWGAGLKGSLVIAKYMGIFGLVIGVIIFMFFKQRQRKLYKFPVTIFSERANGQVEEIKDLGAFIRRKNTSPFFRLLKRKKEMTTPPVLYGISQLNHLYYYQKDMDTYIQLKPQISKEILTFIPIDADIKYGAILEIARIREVIKEENKFLKYAPLIGIILLFVLAIVFLYMLLQKFDPELSLRVAEQTRLAAEALAKAKAGGT